MNYRVGMMALVLVLALAAAFTGNVQAGSYSFSFSIPYKNLNLWPGALLLGKEVDPVKGEVDPVKGVIHLGRDGRDTKQFTISGVVDITGSKMRKVGDRFLYENVDIKESFLNEEYVTNPHDAKLWLSEENGEKKFSALQITYDEALRPNQYGHSDEKDALVVTLSKSLILPYLELTFRASEDFIWWCSKCLDALFSFEDDETIQYSLFLHGFIINDTNFRWQVAGKGKNFKGVKTK